MVRTMGRFSSQASDRGGSQVGGQGSSQVSGRGVGQGAGRGVGGGSFPSIRLASERGVGRGSSQSSRSAGEHGVGRRSGLFCSQQSSLGGRQAGDDDESVVHTMHSPIEGSDDESTFRVGPVRRGCASQVQVPEPINRKWIYIKDGEFSNQGSATRIIGSNLRALWSGPWDSWRDVSNAHRARLFERFQSYFQWEKKWDAEFYWYWEKCIAGKFPNMLKTVRNKAKAEAIENGLQVGNDMFVVLNIKPKWIRTDTWKRMIENWNKPTWQAKSKRNKRIRKKSTGGKHTLGSQSYATAKRKAAKVLGREPSTHEMWKQSHCRKGSRPLDNDLCSNSSLVSDIDSEGNIEEENLVWIDDRAEETWVKYNGYLVERYVDEPPKFDQESWKQAAGGIKRGKVYGLGLVSDTYVHVKQDPKIEKLNAIIIDLVKEKEEDKEKLNAIIAELMGQMKKEKVEKDTMLERMTKIEAILATSVRK